MDRLSECWCRVPTLRALSLQLLKEIAREVSRLIS